MRPVELITPATWHFSVGDIASQQGTQLGLSGRGVPILPVTKPSGKHQCIIGPGYYYAKGEMTGSRWAVLMQGCKPRGPHILNAAGIHIDTNQDLSFLRDWVYVSVRDFESAEIARKYSQNVHLVPCPAMLVEAVDWDFLCSIPNYDFFRSYVPGEYIVVDKDDALSKFACKQKSIIAVDSRPWLVRPWTKRCRLAPPTHSPEVLSAILANAKAVLTRSLHVGILSLSVGTPFAFYNIEAKDTGDSTKSERYWTRAGFSEIVYRGKYPIEHAISLKDKMTQVRESEFNLLHKHLDRLYESCEND